MYIFQDAMISVKLGLPVLFLLLFVYGRTALVCYNGTFSYKDYGEDPVTYRGLFGPSRIAMARTRCWLTVPCEEGPMSKTLQLIVLVCCVRGSEGVFCYNCTATHDALTSCAGEFAPSYFLAFNTSKKHLSNCSGEYAMCYVRSWRARAKHAWIVQRGCYQSTGAEDPIPRLMNKPTRSMSCTKRRLVEAEYKVCLCQANWCNSAVSNLPFSISVASMLTMLYLQS